MYNVAHVVAMCMWNVTVHAFRIVYAQNWNKIVFVFTRKTGDEVMCCYLVHVCNSRFMCLVASVYVHTSDACNVLLSVICCLLFEFKHLQCDLLRPCSKLYRQSNSFFSK